MKVTPMNFVRFGEAAPVPEGVYVHVGELRLWLLENDGRELADALEQLELAPATARHEVVSWEATAP
jgi:hypothetical protein